MPVNYANGKIYELIFGDEPQRYIGSTTQTLVKRVYQHRKKAVNPLIKRMIEKVGRENVKIVLVEAYPCVIKDDLARREQYWMDKKNCQLNFRNAHDDLTHAEKMAREKVRKEIWGRITDELNAYMKQQSELGILKSTPDYMRDLYVGCECGAADVLNLPSYIEFHSTTKKHLCFA
jgi:hypothetical protein